MSADRFDELRRAADEGGLRALAAHLDDPTVAAALGRFERRRRRVWPLLLAVLTFLLPIVAVGATTVTGLRVGSTDAPNGYVGPTQVFSGGGGGGGIVQTLGPGGIPTANCGAALVTCLTSNQTSDYQFSTVNGTLDCQSHTLKKLIVNADGATAQNCFISGAGNAGIYAIGANITIQNNDVSHVNEGGAGDINAVTWFGDGMKLLFNNYHDVVSGALNGSHTDCMQTWATGTSIYGKARNASSNVLIKGNRCTGPPASDPNYIHQCSMAEGPDTTDGGGGGSGVSQNWTFEDNYCQTYGTQNLKFDDIHTVMVRRNTFAGSANKVVATGSLSTGITFVTSGADANIITGSYGATVGS